MFLSIVLPGVLSPLLLSLVEADQAITAQDRGYYAFRGGISVKPVYLDERVGRSTAIPHSWATLEPLPLSLRPDQPNGSPQLVHWTHFMLMCDVLASIVFIAFVLGGAEHGLVRRQTGHSQRAYAGYLAEMSAKLGPEMCSVKARSFGRRLALTCPSD